MTSPGSAPAPHITAVIVAHDGARWLPRLLTALETGATVPDELVAVDTGSSDATGELLRSSFGDRAVIDAPRDTGFGDAVRVALASVADPPEAAGREWIWLLHDDCAPAPAALDELVSVAVSDSRIGVVGGRLRAWPRGRRLLEVGVTISGTGRRMTGLEPGEHDQGQHDEQRDVLAVSTAGMLVRRDLWEQLGGLDPALPLFRDDVDFGWRAAQAGYRVVVAPAAVVFHAEAAARGARPIDCAQPSPHRADRRAALYTLLVNCSAAALPLQYLRLVAGSCLRSLGYLLGKLPGAALDELRAAGSVLATPWRIAMARRRRRPQVSSRRAARALLPPWWAPYADGLDSVLSRLSESALDRANSMSASMRRLRAGRTDATSLETGPVADEAVNLPSGRGPGEWLLAHPRTVLAAVLTVLALVAGGDLLGSGFLQGGGLAPAPDGASDWWGLYLQSSHPVGAGSDLTTAPYVAMLAVPATVLLGKAWLVVDLLMLLAVPLAAVSAYVASGRLVSSRGVRVWAATTYGLLPVLTGAVGNGRIGTVAATIALPWLVWAAAPLFGPGTPRWRWGWASGLVLAVIVAFVPVGWLVAAALGLAAVASFTWSRQPARSGPVVLAVALPLLLLLPWSWRLLTHPHLLLTEAGLVQPELAGVPDAAWHLPFGRWGVAGEAPWWLTAGVLVAAAVALLRPSTRGRVSAAWLVAGVASMAAVLTARQVIPVPGTDAEAHAWGGFGLVVAQAALIAAIAFAADGVLPEIRSGSFGWRQPVAGSVAALALAAPLLGLGWWVAADPAAALVREPAVPLPEYMTDAMHDGRRVLVIHSGTRVRYRLLEGAGRRLGDESVTPPNSSPALTRLVTDLLSRGGAESAAGLAERGVRYVVLTAPADPRLVATLDAVPGLTTASTDTHRLTGWQVRADDVVPAPAGSTSATRVLLLAGQAVVWVIVLVMAAPGLTRRRGIGEEVAG